MLGPVLWCSRLSCCQDPLWELIFLISSMLTGLGKQQKVVLVLGLPWSPGRLAGSTWLWLGPTRPRPLWSFVEWTSGGELHSLPLPSLSVALPVSEWINLKTKKKKQCLSLWAECNNLPIAGLIVQAVLIYDSVLNTWSVSADLRTYLVNGYRFWKYISDPIFLYDSCLFNNLLPVIWIGFFACICNLLNKPKFLFIMPDSGNTRARLKKQLKWCFHLYASYKEVIL